MSKSAVQDVKPFAAIGKKHFSFGRVAKAALWGIGPEHHHA